MDSLDEQEIDEREREKYNRDDDCGRFTEVRNKTLIKNDAAAEIKEVEDVPGNVHVLMKEMIADC